MNQMLWKLMEDSRFHVLKLELEYLKTVDDPDKIAADIADKIIDKLKLPISHISEMKEFDKIFNKAVLKKPLILIMDEFDALNEDAIAGLASVFRNIYNNRRMDPNPSASKEYLLHGVALIGVRNVLGIENDKGSPFNVQCSLHIPRLTYNEVDGMKRRVGSMSNRK